METHGLATKIIAKMPKNDRNCESSARKLREPPKGNRHMRRLLSQTANVAVKVKGSIFEIIYRRCVSRLGHNPAIGVIVHRQVSSDVVDTSSGNPIRRTGWSLFSVRICVPLKWFTRINSSPILPPIPSGRCP